MNAKDLIIFDRRLISVATTVPSIVLAEIYQTEAETGNYPQLEALTEQLKARYKYEDGYINKSMEFLSGSKFISTNEEGRIVPNEKEILSKIGKINIPSIHSFYQKKLVNELVKVGPVLSTTKKHINVDDLVDNYGMSKGLASVYVSEMTNKEVTPYAIFDRILRSAFEIASTEPEIKNAPIASQTQEGLVVSKTMEVAQAPDEKQPIENKEEITQVQEKAVVENNPEATSETEKPQVVGTTNHIIAHGSNFEKAIDNAASNQTSNQVGVKVTGGPFSSMSIQNVVAKATEDNPVKTTTETFPKAEENATNIDMTKATSGPFPPMVSSTPEVAPQVSSGPFTPMTITNQADTAEVIKDDSFITKEDLENSASNSIAEELPEKPFTSLAEVISDMKQTSNDVLIGNFEAEKKSPDVENEELKTPTIPEEAEIPEVSGKATRKKKDKKTEEPNPPGSLQEVYEWAQEFYKKTILASGDTRFALRDYLFKAETAFNNYTAGNWYDMKGDAVINWKNKIAKVWFASMSVAPPSWKPMDFEVANNTTLEGILKIRHEKQVSGLSFRELKEFVAHPDADAFGKAQGLQILDELKMYKNQDITDLGNQKIDALKMTRLRIEQLKSWTLSELATERDRLIFKETFNEQ